jgi:glucan 1,4-alpha-glucosidase
MKPGTCPGANRKRLVDNHNATTFYLKSADNQLLNITFKVFNDGFGFQYEIPRQNNLDSVLVLNEFSEFKLTDNHQVWWQPGDWDIYEHLYQTHPLLRTSMLLKYRNHP